MMLLTFAPQPLKIDTNDKAVEPISWSAIAVIALESLAAKVGEKIGEAIGGAIGDAIRKMLGVGGGDNLDPQLMQQMLDRMADRIIHDISLKIDRNEVRKLNADVLAYQITFANAIKAPQTNSALIDGLRLELRKALFQLASLSEGGGSTPLRAAVLPAATVCGSLLILCEAKWYELALNRNAQDIVGVRDGLSETVGQSIAVIEAMISSVRQDFENQVRGPTDTTHVSRCKELREGKHRDAIGRDIYVFVDKPFPALEAYLYGERHLAVGPTCNSASDSRPALQERCQVERAKLAATFKAQYGDPHGRLKALAHEIREKLL